MSLWRENINKKFLMRFFCVKNAVSRMVAITFTENDYDALCSDNFENFIRHACNFAVKKSFVYECSNKKGRKKSPLINIPKNEQIH